MTERTVAKQTRVALEDDDLSIHSTETEQYSEDQEFEVERILSETKDQYNRLRYLILWAGYPEHKATWEPKKNVQDPEIFKAWKLRKDQEVKGEKEKFDVPAFNARLAEIKRIKADKHRRRKIKKKKLGIPVSPSESEIERLANNSESSTEAMEVDEAPADDPGIKNKSKVSLNKLKKMSPLKPKKASVPRAAVDESSDIEPHPKRRESKQLFKDEDDDSSPDDMFVPDKEKKAKQRKALQALRDKRSTSAMQTPEVRFLIVSDKMKFLTLQTGIKGVEKRISFVD